MRRFMIGRRRVCVCVCVCHVLLLWLQRSVAHKLANCGLMYDLDSDPIPKVHAGGMSTGTLIDQTTATH